MTAKLIPALPRNVRERVEAIRAEAHPGLLLDRFVRICRPDGDVEKISEHVQGPAVREVAEAINTFPSRHAALLAFALEQRASVIAGIRSTVGNSRTWCSNRIAASPIAPHLSRANALENAGIALHRTYGFPLLPGTGLKGLSCAYACENWLPTQPDPQLAWRQILAVFGWADASHLNDLSTRLSALSGRTIKPPKDAQAGAVTFLDAWPAAQNGLPIAWPRVAPDIVNCHHSKYYQGSDPPGDWESPIPVNFLSIEPGAAFEFVLASTRADGDRELLGLAWQWQNAALETLGFGAKTAGGYGTFSALETAPPEGADLKLPAAALPRPDLHMRMGLRLTLTTPAFLCGADQTRKEDCRLRVPTLRGQLRKWWRTLHAAALSVDDLRRLEASIWGDTNFGSPVRIRISSATNCVVEKFDFKQDRGDPRPDFKRLHSLEDPPNKKTTQGLFYLAYGMDQISRGESRKRFFLHPGAVWQVEITVRPGYLMHSNGHSGCKVAVEQISLQVEAAFRLLCGLGGVGSKARKGFGSLQLSYDSGESTSIDLAGLAQSAADLRRSLGLREQTTAGLPESAAIAGKSPTLVEVTTPWCDPWFALDQVGFTMQAFAQSRRHQVEKASLGLPRKIHGPREDGPIRGLQNETDWSPPQYLRSRRNISQKPQDARFASPIHIHLEKIAASLLIRAAAFPVRDACDASVRDEQSIVAILKDCIAHLKSELTAKSYASRGPSGTPATPRVGPAKRSMGAPARVKLIAKREKGGYSVQEVGRPVGTLNLGAIPNPPPVIENDQEVFVDVFVHDDANPPQYRWDRPPAPRPVKRTRGPRR